MRAWFPDPDGGSKQFQRGYTFAEIDPENGTLAVDFVIHSPAGPASYWALHCEDDAQSPLPEGPNITAAWVDQLPDGQTLVQAIGGRDWTDWYAWVTAESTTTRHARTVLQREYHLNRGTLHAQGLDGVENSLETEDLTSEETSVCDFPAMRLDYVQTQGNIEWDTTQYMASVPADERQYLATITLMAGAPASDEDLTLREEIIDGIEVAEAD